MKMLFFQNCFSNLSRRLNKEEVNEQSQSDGNRTQQYFTAVCACTIIAATASYNVWSSPSIPHLTSKKFKFSVTEEQIIWIVSLYNVGDIFGAILNPLFIDRIGRKNTLLLLSLPSLIGWGLIIFAQNYIYLYIARLFGGISKASAFNSLSIYLTEISDKNVRGMLVNMMHISLYIGVFVFTTIGAFASYETLNISSVSILIIFILIISFLPETPYYYLLQGRRADAMKCLMKLRGISSSDKLEPEIREMELVIDEDKKNTKTFAFLELFTKSYNRKGLIIMFFMRATMMLSGIVAITAFAEDIFSQNSLPIKPGVQVMIYNGITLPATLCTGFFIDKINRRILFSATSMLGSFCLGSVGLFFFLKYYLMTETSSIAWLPVVALTLLQIFFISGFGIIPHISIGEFFSIKVKGSAVSLGRILISVINFATTAGYKPLSNSFGIYTTFWIFASLTFVGSLVTYWITPNTTGMTLEEIQAMQNPELENKLNLERKYRRNENT
ncbi:facilitated trehalose transporter Tret1-like [Leptopilina boulardi]|uniref:facilitated trehalose transporter Tret1-like n=1 Tax=Leptopilina boulardi TaxID=63433 RepID=UPI0021F66D4B|nr:facilitated trehalose transporter Tret1-like [Leptopilina boulardi]